MTAPKRKPWVDVRTLTLDEWLAYLSLPEEKQPEAFAGYCFPSSHHLEEYVATIRTRSDKEIKLLLRNFLLMGGSLGVDADRFRWYTSQDDFLTLLDEHEYVKRLINRKRHTWEGMSWIIDLLPNFPAAAIAAIEAYNIAHYFILPDGRISSLSDAITIIRAKYLEAITEDNLANSINPRDFEFLVAALYQRSKYNVRVTRQTRDDGYDIVATKDSRGSIERILVECKCTRVLVRVAVARSLMGTLDLYRATKGVLVVTSKFTAPAIAFAKSTARLELVDHQELCRRFNKIFGPNWTSRISQIVTSTKAELGKEIETVSGSLPKEILHRQTNPS